MLADIEDQVKQVIAIVFESYKSLDESLPSGLMDVFKPASQEVAPALAPAIKLYILLHDILSPKAQLKFCRYFQVLEANSSLYADPSSTFLSLFIIMSK